MEPFAREEIAYMLSSCPPVLAVSLVPFAGTVSFQGLVFSNSSQVSVQVSVAREPRPKVPDDSSASTSKNRAATNRPVPQSPLVSRAFTGQVALRLPTSARITVNDEQRVLRQQLTVSPQGAFLWQAAAKPGQPSLYKKLPFIGKDDSNNNDRIAFLLAKTALLDPISASILAGDNPRPVLEREGVTHWTNRPDTVMADGTSVTVLSGTDDTDPERGKPRRTYVFAFGKTDKLLRRFYSEVFQPDGTVKKRIETYTSVQVNPQLDDRLFVFTPPTGSQPYQPVPLPPAPRVSSLPEDAPEVPEGLRFRTTPATIGGSSTATEKSLGAAPVFRPGKGGASTGGVRVPRGASVTPAPSTSSPLIVVSTDAGESNPALYSFGDATVLGKRQIEKTFTIQNTSDRPVTIERLVNSCDCLLSRLESAAPLVLAPGKTAPVTVVLDLGVLTPGLVQKSVLVFTREQPDSPAVRLQLQGRLVPWVTFTPAVLNLGQVRAGESSHPKTVVATIQPELLSRVRASKLPLLPPTLRESGVVLTLAVDQAGLNEGQARFEVRTDPSAINGPLQTSIGFVNGGTSTAQDNPLGWPSRVPLTVLAQVVGELTAQPALLAFGPVKREEATTRTRRVRLQGKPETLQTLQVESANALVQVKLLPINPEKRGEVILEVVLSPELREGLLEARMIVTAPSTKERLMIPISAFLTKP